MSRIAFLVGAFVKRFVAKMGGFLTGNLTVSKAGVSNERTERSVILVFDLYLMSTCKRLITRWNRNHILYNF